MFKYNAPSKYITNIIFIEVNPIHIILIKICHLWNPIYSFTSNGPLLPLASLPDRILVQAQQRQLDVSPRLDALLPDDIRLFCQHPHLEVAELDRIRQRELYVVLQADIDQNVFGVVDARLVKEHVSGNMFN